MMKAMHHLPLLVALLALTAGAVIQARIAPRMLITAIPATGAAKCASSIIKDTDFQYGDLTSTLDKKYQGVKVESADACCVRCMYTDGCSRWSWNSKDGRCWLKGTTGWTQKSATGLTSGVLTAVGKAAPGGVSDVTTTTTTPSGVTVDRTVTATGSGPGPVVANSDVSMAGTGNVVVSSSATATNTGR